MVADRLEIRAELDRLKIITVAECAGVGIVIGAGVIGSRSAAPNRHKPCAELHIPERRTPAKGTFITAATDNFRQRIRKRQRLKCCTIRECSVIDRRNPFRELNLGYAEILKGIHADCRHSCAVDRCRKRQRSGQCRSVGLYDVRERCFTRTFSIGPFKTVAVSILCGPCRSRATDRRADCHNRL